MLLVITQALLLAWGVCLVLKNNFHSCVLGRRLAGPRISLDVVLEKKKPYSLLNPDPWRKFEPGIISGCAVISFYKEDAAN